MKGADFDVKRRGVCGDVFWNCKVSAEGGNEGAGDDIMIIMSIPPNAKETRC